MNSRLRVMVLPPAFIGVMIAESVSLCLPLSFAGIPFSYFFRTERLRAETVVQSGRQSDPGLIMPVVRQRKRHQKVENSPLPFLNDTDQRHRHVLIAIGSGLRRIQR